MPSSLLYKICITFIQCFLRLTSHGSPLMTRTVRWSLAPGPTRDSRCSESNDYNEHRQIHRQTDRQTNTDKYTKHPGLTQGVQKAMVITKTNIRYSAFSKQNIWFSIWQFLFPHSWIWCWTQRREGTSVGSCQMVRVKASRQSKLHKIMISWTTYQISLHSITCFGWKFHLHHNSS